MQGRGPGFSLPHPIGSSEASGPPWPPPASQQGRGRMQQSPAFAWGREGAMGSLCWCGHQCSWKGAGKTSAEGQGLWGPGSPPHPKLERANPPCPGTRRVPPLLGGAWRLFPVADGAAPALRAAPDGVVIEGPRLTCSAKPRKAGACRQYHGAGLLHLGLAVTTAPCPARSFAGALP